MNERGLDRSGSIAGDILQCIEQVGFIRLSLECPQRHAELNNLLDLRAFRLYTTFLK